jgi:DNA-directed RNA polymerase subunit B'
MATKVFVNGRWIGWVDTPLEVRDQLRVLRRNGVLPLDTSIGFDYRRNELRLLTDAGRLRRLLYFVEPGNKNVPVLRGR